MAAAHARARGALLCSAYSGIFLLAETGLFDGRDATVHFGYARAFVDAFPTVPIHPQRVLVVSGTRAELVAPVDEIGWRVGYEDGAFFRRLFKRTTGMAPGAYRKRFRTPEFART